MKKIKVEELGCFNEVASVIGVTEAKRELFIAVNDDETDILNLNLYLSGAFVWSSSPQGLDFWVGVDDKITHNQP